MSYLCPKCGAYIPEGTLKYIQSCFCGSTIDDNNKEKIKEILERAKTKNDTENTD